MRDMIMYLLKQTQMRGTGSSGVDLSCCMDQGKIQEILYRLLNSWRESHCVQYKVF